MSNPDTPITPADSQGEDQPRQHSTQASTPMTDDKGSKPVIENGSENGNGEENNAGPAEDVEEMDTKAKALMHLLNTSEVCFSFAGPGSRAWGLIMSCGFL